MNKKRYQEEYEEGSNLLWPREVEDKVTESFIEIYHTYLKNISY